MENNMLYLLIFSRNISEQSSSEKYNLCKKSGNVGKESNLILSAKQQNADVSSPNNNASQ